MKKILTIISLILTSYSYSQFNGLTTVFKQRGTDILVSIENYNEHYIRQELADCIFYNYINNKDKKAIIELNDFTVEGELFVREDSPKTVVLIYRCNRFIKK